MNVVRKPERMTAAEFLDWDTPDGNDRLWQLIDGEPVQMSPPTVNHGVIVAQVALLLGSHLRSARPECRVIAGPGVRPRARAGFNIRIPDLAVACSPPLGERLLSAPVVLVEVLSPSNEPITRSNMWSYTTIESASEILLVESTRVAAELLRRGPDGNWPDDPEGIGPDGEVALPSLGFRAALRELYRGTSLSAP